MDVVPWGLKAGKYRILRSAVPCRAKIAWHLSPKTRRKLNPSIFRHSATFVLTIIGFKSSFLRPNSLPVGNPGCEFWYPQIMILFPTDDCLGNLFGSAQENIFYNNYSG
jgi:hypothetical protein